MSIKSKATRQIMTRMQSSHKVADDTKRLTKNKTRKRRRKSKQEFDANVTNSTKL
jgi:hypothetical protein